MIRITLVVSCALLLGCAPQKQETTSLEAFKRSSTDKLVMYSIQNKNGLKMSVTNFGGRIVSLWVPDKTNVLANVVLGYDSVQKYLTGNPYFGAMIGRYGNRIANGKFSLNGLTYQLPMNNGNNSLHGGPNGFHNVFWDVRADSNEIEMSYISKDGEEGYPGNLKVKVTYSLSEQNEIIIDYEGITDKPTVVNLTHHSFFNLAGEGNGDVLNHQMTINADKFTPVDEGLIPTGEIKSVSGTAFDFRKPHAIGERINNIDQQLTIGQGYDHNWVLNKKSNELALAATVAEPTSGRVMEVWTTEPGLQFYSGNFLNSKDIGPSGKPYQFRSAFCLEAQHYPDSPNHSSFPSTVLNPGDTYKQRTIYKFVSR
ncbi:galactose mutarotase [soil metagenome]